MLIVSSSSYEGYFSSSDSSEEESIDTSTKSNQDGKGTSTREQNNQAKDHDMDEELSKSIAKIEGQYISTMHDHHLNIKKDKKKIPKSLDPNIKIKKEEDNGTIEMAFLVRTIQGYQTNVQELNQCILKI